MKKTIRFILYICLHIMLAVFFIDNNSMDKTYAFVFGIIFGLICYFLRPCIDVTRKKMMDRTYYYLLFALFLPLASFIYKIDVDYDWFNVYGFKIWLNVIAAVLILKSMYAFICKYCYQRRNPSSYVKAATLLRKK